MERLKTGNNGRDRTHQKKRLVKQSENQNTKKPKQKIIDMKARTKKLQQELVLVLDKAGMPKEVVNYVSTTVEKNAEDKNRKHSNIMFCDEDNKILDSIKHISGLVSSVREVLPGKPWFIPHTQEKFDPLTADRTLFMKQVFIKPCDCFKALYTTFTVYLCGMWYGGCVLRSNELSDYIDSDCI